MQGLKDNMEDNENADDAKPEIKNLGKIQYTLDYDFAKGEVSLRLKLQLNK